MFGIDAIENGMRLGAVQPQSLDAARRARHERRQPAQEGIGHVAVEHHRATGQQPRLQPRLLRQQVALVGIGRHQQGPYRRQFQTMQGVQGSATAGGASPPVNAAGPSPVQ